MANVLKRNSAREDISNYIKSFSQRTKFTQEDLEELLANLTQLEIDTYKFSIGANIAAKTISKSIVVELEEYLSIFFEKEKKGKKSVDKAFCAYYLLTYYYRIYEKMDKFSNVIDLYQSFFEQREERYALAYQIRGRYLRRRGDGGKALDYDRKAKELLEKKGIDNIQVSITNASTIAIALENRESYVTDEDIKSAMNIVQKAIVGNQEYAKYYYLLAKLKIFSLLYKNDHGILDGIDYGKEIKEAKELIRNAIELEDIKADSYATSISEYKTYLRSADIALAELQLTNKINCMEIEHKNMIETRFEKNNQETLEKIKNAQDKYLEILAIFVSIVSIIMVVIGSFSQKFSTTQILVITTGMCIGTLIIYSAFLIMLRKKIEKKHIITLVFSCILEIVLIAFSYSKL